MISDFFTWLFAFGPGAQLLIALVVIAGVATFLFVFRRGRDEQRSTRWIVAVAAALLISLIVVAIVNILRLLAG